MAGTIYYPDCGHFEQFYFILSEELTFADLKDIVAHIFHYFFFMQKWKKNIFLIIAK